MEVSVAVLIGLFVGAAVVLAAVRSRSTGGPDVRAELTAMRQQVAVLSERVTDDTTVVGRRLEGIDSRMTETQVANSALASSIFDALGEVRTATSTVADQARRFGSLQEILQGPKARGGLGEALLEELLRQVLPPPAYSCQHRFSSGVVVDAVVRAGGRLVCIDSKFPLANYRRMCDARDDAERREAERAFAGDVDKHIADISSRYIVPDEGTFDFAVMYVPAEGVYAEVLRLAHRKRPLFESAIESRVVPMSPLTMYGYLQTILFGLKCLRIERNAEAILDFCGRLQRDFERFADDYDTLGRHIGHARSKYEEGSHRLDRFREKLDRAVDLADERTPGVDDDPRPSLEVVND